MSDGQDVRQRMVEAAQELVSMRGFGVTMLDVVARAKAPRGSIYYYFPEGKEQVFREAVQKAGAELEVLVAAKSRRHADIGDLLTSLVNHHLRRLVASGYDEGCPLVAMTASSDLDSTELRDVVQAAFSGWTSAISAELHARGVDAASSDRLASVFVSAVEGAIVRSRAHRDPTPLEQVKELVPVIAAAASGPDSVTPMPVARS